MIYLLLSFFITFSAHSMGHDHGRPDYTVKTKLDSLKEKQNEIIDNVKSNRKTLSEIAPAVDHNRKTINSISDRLDKAIITIDSISDRLDNAIKTIDKTADRQAQSCSGTSQRGSTGQR